MGDDLVKLCQEMGLGVTLALATFVAFFFLLKWVLKTSAVMLDKMHEREMKSWEVMNGYQKALLDHTAQAKEFHNSVTEAHKYQREEHGQMIQILGRMNGYKDHK
jgi:hypothetical protein